jgi:hypothetical protein
MRRSRERWAGKASAQKRLLVATPRQAQKPADGYSVASLFRSTLELGSANHDGAHPLETPPGGDRRKDDWDSRDDTSIGHLRSQAWLQRDASRNRILDRKITSRPGCPAALCSCGARRTSAPSFCFGSSRGRHMKYLEGAAPLQSNSGCN